MATVEEERAKVKLGTSGGSIYTPGTPTMQAQGAMNSNVATALRGAVSNVPGGEFGSGIRGRVGEALETGGVPRAVGQAVRDVVTAPFYAARDIVNPPLAATWEAAKEFGKGIIGDNSTAPVEQPQVSAVQAAGATPQVQPMPSHGGVRTAAQVQPPVEEGGGMIRDSQTGEVVRMDPAGNISRFDSAGNPISKLSPRQWGGSQSTQAAPAPRGLTVTNLDGTTEFFPASTEQAPPVWGLRPATQEQATTGYVPREIKTWGDWMAEKKDRAAYGLNTQRMIAEAGTAKTMEELANMPAERQSIQGLRAAQAAEAQAKIAGAGEERGLKKQYYDILGKAATAKEAKGSGLKPYTTEKESVGKEGINKTKFTKFFDPVTGTVIDPENLPSANNAAQNLRSRLTMLPPARQQAFRKWAEANPTTDPAAALEVLSAGKF